MNEFIGIDFGTNHCHTGIFRSGHYEYIRNYYDHNEIDLILGQDEYFRQKNINIPAFIGLKQLLGFYLKNADNQKRIFDSVETLFKIVFENSKEHLQTNTINGVITVPCYYHDRERSALISLTERAGFNQIRLLDENVALALGLDLKKEAKNILIYSMGAGLFTCTILNHEGNNYRPLNSEYSNNLSGTFFDSAILQKINESLNLQSQELSMQIQSKLIGMATKAKKELSQLQQSVIQMHVKRQSGNSGGQIPETRNLSITRKEFDEIVKNFIQESIQLSIRAINNAGLKKEDIDLVLLAGGSTNIPVVQKMIYEAFKTEIILTDVNSIARGAAIFASSLPSPEIKEKQPLKQPGEQTRKTIQQDSSKKSKVYAFEWVEKFTADLEEYHQLWQNEAYSESIAKMELVQKKITKFIANLCHSAGKKQLDKGLFKEAFSFLKNGYNYDKNDSLLMSDLFSCYDKLINDSLNKGDYQLTLKYLKEALDYKNGALSYAPNSKVWKDLQSRLRNMPKNYPQNKVFRKN